MNTVALESSVDLTPYPDVATSILNFGLPDMARRSLDESMLEIVRRDIERAVRRYEPRLAPDTVNVIREGLLEEGALKVRFLVQADLLCDPARVPVEFVADVDLDTAKVQVGRR
jgi:type VI secretion system protein ImpF